MTFDQNIKVLEAKAFNNATFEILELDEMRGAKDAGMAMQLYFAKQQGLKIRQVRVHLNNTAIKTEAGALYYHYGNIQSRVNAGGVGGFIGKSIKGALTSESAMKPEYGGTGTIYLEPSFSHYLIVSLENESIVVDKSLFYCCNSEIQVEPFMQKNISSALMGGEGLFQIRLTGTGVCVLEIPVPVCEIQEFQLFPGQSLKVDGNFAIMRDATVDFAVTRSDKSLIGSAVNGEGLLNTFTTQVGGKVWLAPTAPLYKKMQFGLPISNTGSNSSQ